MLQYNDSVMKIKGVGEKTAALLKKCKIETVEDLIFYLPRGFQKFEEPVEPNPDLVGKKIAILATPLPHSITAKKTGKYILSFAKVQCKDQMVQLRFFNIPYLKNVLQPGKTVVLLGKLEGKKDKKTGVTFYSMLQPKIWEEEKYRDQLGHLSAIYPLTKGLSNKTVEKACFFALENIAPIEDAICKEDLDFLQLVSLQDAYHYIHCPKTEAEFEMGRRRLAFQEFFIFLYELQKNKFASETGHILEPLLPVADTNRMIEQLPFTLTGEQKKVWREIEADLEKDIPMNRLLQGDVGSGKTILAFLTLLKACANGKQACFMAPTEVLAEQHFRSLMRLCEDLHLCMKPVLLLGSMSAKEKREKRSSIKNGSVNVIIGTHAIMQDSVEYQNLAVAITDEQHRFGVNQRETLRKKGNAVHVLVMSATPIPRTLALILYGDLSISTIHELPSNRLAIKNCVVGENYRETAYHFMNQEILKGRQIYIICPMIDSNDASSELENVVDYSEKIQNYFPKNCIISYLHGKMSFREKEEIMNAFADGNIDILVATTVVEVGINVPNATVMMIENAERYGLAQLHQLRGRVGRGKEQSYCIFMSQKTNEKNRKRLEILNHSNDGFEIANQDLALRGPGEIGGIRQSGELGFYFADIYEDQDLLRKASSFLQEKFSRQEWENHDFSAFFKMKQLTDKLQTL